MKTRLIWLGLLLISSLGVLAQERDRDRIQDQNQTKILALNGTLLQVRDHAELRLQDRQTLSDGTVIQPNGRYTAPNGKRYRLAEGECLDGDGALYRNEYQYRHKIEQENAGLSQAQMQQRNQQRLHYTLVDGNVYQIRHQEQIRLQDQLRLENGTTVFPDGSYQLENQERKRLENGACLDPSGQIFRNTYMFQKQLILKRAVPVKNMVRKGVAKPDISG
jgi:hypothetical protein